MSNTAIIPISFSLPKSLAKELDKEAKMNAMTRSEFVRDSIRRQLAFARLRELQAEASRRAPQAGLRTNADVVRAVRELRDHK